MLKKLVIALLLSYLALQAQEPQSLKYFVNINENFKGILTLNNSKKGTEVLYHNISTRDKIPFFAPKKEFTFTKLHGVPTLKTLQVADKSRRVIYDLSKLTADEIDETDVSEEDLPNTVIIYNKNDLPSETLEKREIHTIESLMLSIYETNRIPSEPFYLYEPHKNMLIKVEFKREGSESLEVGDINCDATTYVLKISNRNKRLIRVYTNGYPLKVESFSKKWSFVLIGAGKKRKIHIKNEDIAFKVYKKEILNKYSDHDVKILSQKVDRSHSKPTYVTKFSVVHHASENDIQQFLERYTADNSAIERGKKANSFKFFVTNEDVLDQLAQAFEVEDDKHYWKKSNYSVAATALLKYDTKHKACKIDKDYKEYICGDDEEDIDYKELLEKYLKTKYKKFELSNVDVEENSFGAIGKVHFELKFLEKITNDLLYPYAVEAIQAKYPENQFSNDLEFVKSKKEWIIYVAKKAVYRYTCSNLIREIPTKYKDGKCQVVSKTVHSLDETTRIVKNYIANKYKDLKILGTKVNYSADGATFTYLNDLKKVQNECK